MYASMDSDLTPAQYRKLEAIDFEMSNGNPRHLKWKVIFFDTCTNTFEENAKIIFIFTNCVGLEYSCNTVSIRSAEGIRREARAFRR